jgi:isocitrate dehydrogenase (NAD+)
MLDYLDMVAKGDQLRQAIRDTMTNDRDSVTPDLGGKGSTDSFADAIVKRVKG